MHRKCKQVFSSSPQHNKMAICTLLVLVAAISQLAGANFHMQKLDNQVRHHSNLLSREFEHRLNEGAKRKVAVYDSKKLPAVDPVHHSQELSALEPSAEPTAQPTENQNLSATGYVYLTQSFNEDCSQPVVSLGVPVNTCLVRYHFAYKVRIVDENWSNAYIDYYSDIHCQQLIEGGVSFVPGKERCKRSYRASSIVINPSVQPGTSKIYSSLHLSTSPMLPRISPSGGSAFEFYRNDTTCGHDSFSSFLIYASNVCLANPMDSFDPRRIDAFSVDCHNVRIHYDLDRLPNCAGVVEHVELPTTCAEHQSLISAERPSVTDDDISVDSNFYNPEWVNLPPNLPVSPISDDAQSPELHRRVTCQAGLVPTVIPTAAPSFTAFPTSNKAVLVTFKVKKQVLNNISKLNFEINLELYSNAVKKAIAASMRGVQASDITDLIVTDSAARTPGALRATLHQMVSRMLQTSAVSLSYTITTTTVYTASQLSAQLQQAITSGEFDTVLRWEGYQNWASSLQSASSQGTIETDIVPSSDNDTEKVLSTGAIIGIAIGGAAFLVIVGVLIWYFSSKSSSAVAPASMSSSVTPF